MKLCAIIERGSVVYATLVEDNHEFGIHDKHFHMEIDFRENIDPECVTEKQERKPYSPRRRNI